jgi:hypothetical protein
MVVRQVGWENKYKNDAWHGAGGISLMSGGRPSLGKPFRIYARAL